MTQANQPNVCPGSYEAFWKQDPTDGNYIICPVCGTRVFWQGPRDHAPPASQGSQGEGRAPTRAGAGSAPYPRKGVMARIKSRHQRPYSLHLPTSGALEQLDAPPESDRRRTRVLDIRDIVEFRDALDLVTRYCEDATHVAAFAMGGLACIEYITRRAGAETAGDLAPYLEKFHVFGGLNWKRGGAENKARFDSWICSLRPGSTVILFDTGRVGNAAGQLLNRMHYLRKSPGGLPDQLTVQIIVLGERGRPNGQDHWQRDFKQPALSLIRDVYRVADVITEDALRLAGYAKLRELGALQPIWVLGHLDLRRHDGSITRMSSASIGPAFVNEMLGNFVHLNQMIDTFPPDQLVTGDNDRGRVRRLIGLLLALLAGVFVVRLLWRRSRGGG